MSYVWEHILPRFISHIKGYNNTNVTSRKCASTPSLFLDMEVLILFRTLVEIPNQLFLVISFLSR